MGYSNFHFLITMRALRAPLSVTKLRVIGNACFQKPSVSTWEDVKGLRPKQSRHEPFLSYIKITAPRRQHFGWNIDDVEQSFLMQFYLQWRKFHRNRLLGGLKCWAVLWVVWFHLKLTSKAASKPLLINISIHILHTVLYVFPKMLTRRICFTVTSFSNW